MAVRTIGTIVGKATQTARFILIDGALVEVNRVFSNTKNLNLAGMDRKPIFFQTSIGGLEIGKPYFIRTPVRSSVNGYFSVSETQMGPVVVLNDEILEVDYVILNFSSDGSTQPNDPSLITSAGRDALNNDNNFFQIDYGDYFERISQSLETLVDQNEQIKDDIRTIKNLAEGDGLHILGPWEWLGQVGIVQYMEDKGLNINELKARIEALPKSFTPPGGGS
jgi:hypothetical protein